MEVGLIKTQALNSLEEFQQKIFEITQKMYLGSDEVPSRAYLYVTNDIEGPAIISLPIQEMMDRGGKAHAAQSLRFLIKDMPPTLGELHYYAFSSEVWISKQEMPDDVTKENAAEYAKKMLKEGAPVRPSQDPNREERVLITVESREKMLGTNYTIDRNDFNKLELTKDEQLMFMGRFVNILYKDFKI